MASRSGPDPSPYCAALVRAGAAPSSLVRAWELLERGAAASSLDECLERELAMANQLIESLSETFDPTKYSDTYRTKVLEVIERKAAGEEDVVSTPEPQEEKVVDLMAALEASVAAAKEARGRHPTAATPGTVSGEEIAGEDAPADEDAAQTA